MGLLLANVVWAAWARDALAPWGWAPPHEQQPERFEQQLRPDALQVMRKST
ncbi:MAG: hypothetical protein RIT26_623 [Pseudomonadota bacterium]